jgi:hypothetical protein
MMLLDRWFGATSYSADAVPLTQDFFSASHVWHYAP